MPTATLPTPSDRRGRIWLAGLGLGLLLAGLLFTWVLWRAFERAQETRSWTPVPALMVRSNLMSEHPTPHSPLAHRTEVAYRFLWQGEKRTGTHLQRVDGPSAHQEIIEERLRPFPVGAEVTAWVDPADPTRSVLLHGTRAALYSIWFPLLIAAGGGGILWRALRGPRHLPSNSPEALP
ncbi:MAG: DUF3592 domain-containing protein [Verrucomicrobiales bacterium]|nr:DUF3592 domain-containing protein [Verrucomicrobiales bacterium]